MVVVLEVCRVGQRPGVLDGVGMLVGCIQDAVARQESGCCRKPQYSGTTLLSPSFPRLVAFKMGFLVSTRRQKTL